MENNDTSKREVFCRYIYKNGKKIYPKNSKFFHFWVENNPDAKVAPEESIATEEK